MLKRSLMLVVQAVHKRMTTSGITVYINTGALKQRSYFYLSSVNKSPKEGAYSSGTNQQHQYVGFNPDYNHMTLVRFDKQRQ